MSIKPSTLDQFIQVANAPSKESFFDRFKSKDSKLNDYLNRFENISSDPKAFKHASTTQKIQLLEAVMNGESSKLTDLEKATKYKTALLSIKINIEKINADGSSLQNLFGKIWPSDKLAKEIKSFTDEINKNLILINKKDWIKNKAISTNEVKEIDNNLKLHIQSLKIGREIVNHYYLDNLHREITEEEQKERTLISRISDNDIFKIFIEELKNKEIDPVQEIIKKIESNYFLEKVINKEEQQFELLLSILINLKNEDLDRLIYYIIAHFEHNNIFKSNSSKQNEILGMLEECITYIKYSVGNATYLKEYNAYLNEMGIPAIEQNNKYQTDKIEDLKTDHIANLKTQKNYEKLIQENDPELLKSHIRLETGVYKFNQHIIESNKEEDTIYKTIISNEKFKNFIMQSKKEIEQGKDPFYVFLELQKKIAHADNKDILGSNKPIGGDEMIPLNIAIVSQLGLTLDSYRKIKARETIDIEDSYFAGERGFQLISLLTAIGFLENFKG